MSSLQSTRCVYIYAPRYQSTLTPQQIFFNPYNYAENKELLEFSQKHGIVTEAYSSLA